MRLVKFLIFILVLAFVTVTISFDVSIAKTPDGKTPAEETVCDVDIGVAYGLCVAYCEAMDCDSDKPHASWKACNKIYRNYVKQTDFEPPCLGIGDGDGNI